MSGADRSGPNSGGGRRGVAVVTGGGRGIGAAIAEELGRTGTYVVTVDPLVALDGGANQDSAAEPTTAERIVAAGGAARASSVSVTDRAGVQALFATLTEELGGVDAVVNVAGISRPTGFASGQEEDWHAVLAVHLDGYLNVLHAALPLMAAAGHGRILGVTSGSGWRAADAGAYSAAKRAVAALTWQVGRAAPDGVVVNALSPIALTRMVTAALARAGSTATGGLPSGGLALGSGMPPPEELGPLGAHLVGAAQDWCSGEVIFGGGSELAVIEPPRLVEVVRADAGPPLAALVDAGCTRVLAPAEAAQASAGGMNPRLRDAFAAAPSDAAAPAASPASTAGVCGVVIDDPALARAVTTALEARGVRCVSVDRPAGAGFAGAAAAIGELAALAAPAGASGGLDAVVISLSGPSPSAAPAAWERILAEHEGLTTTVAADAAWARAAADHARAAHRPMRLVALIDASTAGGKSRAQAAAQLCRSALAATDGLVAATVVAVESPTSPSPLHAAVAAEVAAHLASHPDAAALSGAELAVGGGWFGLRSHPRPSAGIVYGGPALPPWLDDVLHASIRPGAIRAR